MSVSIWPFIEQGADGVAYIEGTRTKVIEVALDQIAYDWDAAEIHRQYPYLSLPQIHAALGFYHENRSDCDRLIDQQLAEVDEWRGSWRLMKHGARSIAYLFNRKRESPVRSSQAAKCGTRSFDCDSHDRYLYLTVTFAQLIDKSRSANRRTTQPNP